MLAPAVLYKSLKLCYCYLCYSITLYTITVYYCFAINKILYMCVVVCNYLIYWLEFGIFLLPKVQKHRKIVFIIILFVSLMGLKKGIFAQSPVEVWNKLSILRKWIRLPLLGGIHFRWNISLMSFNVLFTYILFYFILFTQVYLEHFFFFLLYLNLWTFCISTLC